MSQANEQPRIFQPGDLFHSHYLVEAYLGAGASGQVYRVQHRFTGDRFALKVAHLKDRGDVQKMARSLAEAQAIYRIQHHNVVRVIDLACEADGMVWQLLELLTGQSLAELLRRFGKLSPLYAIAIILEIAWGLQAAHEHQVIHRDIKPSNVFLTKTGQVKVLDFSLAKVLLSGIETTLAEGTLGTGAYMSPEHLQKARPTAQFDVYAVGLMLWQMLAGRHPFEPYLHNAMRLVDKQLHEDPESLVTAAGLPAYCDEVIRRATAKDPAQRYPGMWPLAQALRDLQQRLLAASGVPGLVPPPPPWELACPVVRNPEGWNQYRAPTTLPGASPAPPVPSKRIVLSPARASAPAPVTPPAAAPIAPPATKPKLAPTVPMPVFDAPRPQAAGPTVRRPAPWRPRPLWAVLVGGPLLVALGVGLWLLVTWNPPASATSSSSSATAPSATTPAASATTPSAEPRRPPAPAPKR